MSRVRFATRKIVAERPLTKALPTLSERGAGALVGLAAGRTLSLRGGPDGTLALALLLADELAAGRRDLRVLAHRWVARHLADPRDIEAETNAALAHLARHDTPPSRAAGQGSDALVRVLPVALAAYDAPRTLVSATYHIAALTHPEPLVAWSAVAVNVALGRLLSGHRDFVADVIEALRSNEVPEPLLAAMRRVPLPSRALEAHAPAVPGQALADAEAALRLLYHEPLPERGLTMITDGGQALAARAGLAGALFGAREGVAALPRAWTAATDGTRLAELAAQLLARAPAPA